MLESRQPFPNPLTGIRPPVVWPPAVVGGNGRTAAARPAAVLERLSVAGFETTLVINRVSLPRVFAQDVSPGRFGRSVVVDLFRQLIEIQARFIAHVVDGGGGQAAAWA